MPFVRLAIPADQSAIAEIDEWREATGEKISAGRCRVAGRDGRIEAYAISSFWFGNKPFVEIIFVTADARRSGLGTALLTAIEADFLGQRLWITTSAQNIPMQQLLKLRGYEPCGTIEKLAKNLELVFSKHLDSL